MYFGMEEKRMLVVKSALFSSNYFNYKKKRKRRQKLHNLVSKSWQAMEGSSAIYTILTLGSMYWYKKTFSSSIKNLCHNPNTNTQQFWWYVRYEKIYVSWKFMTIFYFLSYIIYTTKFLKQKSKQVNMNFP